MEEKIGDLTYYLIARNDRLVELVGIREHGCDIELEDLDIQKFKLQKF